MTKKRQRQRTFAILRKAVGHKGAVDLLKSDCSWLFDCRTTPEGVAARLLSHSDMIRDIVQLNFTGKQGPVEYCNCGSCGQSWSIWTDVQIGKLSFEKIEA